YRHARALAYFRFDAKFVYQAFAASQAEPHARTGSEAIFQRQIDIRNSGPIVRKDQTQAGLRSLVENFEGHLAAPAVIESVAPQFAGCGYQLGLVNQAETQFNRP